MSDEITVKNPEILGGTPRSRGTRLSVDVVAARHKSGETAEEIFDGYPAELALGEGAIAAAVRYAGMHNPGRSNRS